MNLDFQYPVRDVQLAARPMVTLKNQAWMIPSGGLACSELVPIHPPDLCGIPSGVEGLGAYAPAQ